MHLTLRQEQVENPVIVGELPEDMVLTDGNQTLELDCVQGNDHVEGMTMGYVPKLRVLVEVDGFNPAARVGGPVQSRNAANLLEKYSASRFGYRYDCSHSLLTDFVESIRPGGITLAGHRQGLAGEEREASRRLRCVRLRYVFTSPISA